MHFFSTVCFSFLCLVFYVPSHECSPVNHAQSAEADTDQKSHPLSPTLLLSALDIEKMIGEGYSDVLLEVYNFFDTKLKQINITLDENKFGSTDTLKDVFEKIMSSSQVSVTIKGKIRTLRFFLRNNELTPETEKPIPASPTIRPVPQEEDLCMSNDRLVMVPFDFGVIKSAGLTNALNRVISYLNKHPSEVLFVDDYFDSDNPLLPFLILLTSPTAEAKVKEDVRTLLPHLRTTLSTGSLHASDRKDNMAVGDRTLEEQNDNAESSFEPSLFLKYYNEINSNRDSSSRNAYNTSDENSKTENVERESLSQRGSFTDHINDGNSVWPFDILKRSQQMVTDNLKQAFVVFQKLFFDAISTVQENTQHTNDILTQLFNTFVQSASSDSELREDLTTLTHYSSKSNQGHSGKEKIKQSVQEISQKMHKGLLENLKTICDSYGRNSKDHVRIEEIADELMKHLKSHVEFDDELERNIRNMLSENCGLRNISTSSPNMSPKFLDNERLSEIKKLLLEYDLKVSENSTFTHQNSSKSKQELEEDIDRLIQKYGLSSARVSTGQSNLSEDVRSLLGKLVPGSLTQSKDPFITFVMVPTANVGTRTELTFEETLKEDIRSLIEKWSCYTSRTNTKGFRKHSIPDKSDMPEEIKLLPLDLDKLANAGCYENLIRLYEYFKTRSYDTVILTPKNMTERSYFMRDIIDMLRRTDSVSEEIKRDASCVSPYITDGNLENRIMVPTTSRAQQSIIQTTTPFNLYSSVALWPIDMTQIVLDGHEENLQRISQHLHNHYHDLLISTQKSEVRRNRIFREVLEKILYSDTVKDELKNDVKIIMPYMIPLISSSSRQTTKLTNSRDGFIKRQLNANEKLYPLNMNKIISSGLSPNLERVLKLCKNHSCDEILETVKDTPRNGYMFRQLLEILKSFSDTDDKLKEDINAISPFVLDTSFGNALHPVHRRSASFTRGEKS